MHPAVQPTRPRRSRRGACLWAALAPAAAVALAAAPARADPGVLVYPGMEILQGSNVCTLGFVDPARRVAFTAGHCRGAGAVTDRDGNFIGSLALYRDNIPNGATVATTQLIADYEAIGLADTVQVNNVLPGGRSLDTDPPRIVRAGDPVCHFGIITGESCGTVKDVNNGWFTMTNGVVSQKGDSGGPVYVPTDNGRAVIVGLFNSTWGDFPAAVSWQAAGQQAQDDAAAGPGLNPPS